MKSSLKRSQFLLSLARSRHALKADLRRARWIRSSRQPIRNYLESAQPKKLNIGAGLSALPGWLNTDLMPAREDIVYMDAANTYPFPDNSFDYVFSEHMIEHIPFNSAQKMLAECHRILKPGGKIRVATPDLSVLLGLYSTEKTPMQKHYVDWMLAHCLPEADFCGEVFVINNAFRAWGHQFLYDRETLKAALSRSGFGDLNFFKPGVSDDDHLVELESHGRDIQAEEINQFETQVWQGVKH